MFKNVKWRYVLRAGVAAVLGGIVSAAGLWVDNPYLQVAGAMATVFGGYLGIGYAVPQVEPNIGSKLEDQ